MGCLTVPPAMLDDVDERRSGLKQTWENFWTRCVPEICSLSDPGCFLKLVETRGDDFPVGDAIEIVRHRQLKKCDRQ
jgi:hypothetical protein